MTTDVTGPGVTECYGFAWSELKRAFLELLVIGVLWFLVCAAEGLLRGGLLSFAYQVLVVGPVSFGGMWAFLRAARGETPDVGDLFIAFRGDFWQAVLASVLVHVTIAVGFVLLIVPGVIAAIRLSWVPYLVVEEKLDAVEAMRQSWEQTRGHGMALFGIWLLAIPLIIAGALVLVVGIVPALMWAQLAFACYYAAIRTRDRAAREAGIDPGPAL